MVVVGGWMVGLLADWVVDEWVVRWWGGWLAEWVIVGAGRKDGSADGEEGGGGVWSWAGGVW